MKQPKKLTRSHKEIIRKKGLNEKDYMLLSEDSTSFIIVAKKENKDGIKEKHTFKK